MSNLFKIKRGATVPTSDVLSAYELGFMTEGGKLYIGLGDSVKMLAAGPSSTLPKAAGNASVGTEDTFARGDHIHPLQTTISGNAGTATKLKTARTIQINLASTSSVSFDGSADITPGVKGILPIANGGTNATTAADACANLGAVKKSGDTMNGTLRAPQMIIKYDTYPTLYFNNSAGNAKAAVICSAGGADHAGGIILRGWKSDGSDYKDLVLTYGNNMVVPVRNGGTGAASASGACSNLGAVKTSGDTMTGILTISMSGNPYLCVKDPSTGESGYFQLYQSYMAMGYTFSKSIRIDSSGNIVIPSGAYGSTLPTAGITGRIFFKKV